MHKESLKIIIIDDHPVVLQGFSYMLANIAGMELVGEFADADTGLAFLRTEHVDIVLLDINLPGKNGIDACEEIQAINPMCKVIAISNLNEYSIIQRMLRAGASGYLLKNASSDEVLDAIHQVACGGNALSLNVQTIIDSAHSGDLPVITRREKEVLQLLSQGLSSGEIGERIFISPLTVESHRRNLLQKFKVVNVAALIHKAMEMKYI
ncbi:LuxR family two component transcriptional regulator [Arcticibacter pallidicorallinus]|uniref:LuxR family two component transcriptional regulator n=1 Tax=Arcticibacter pallidicorallinus TaxID=1259464 RepID=A0A2T0TU76_9SPHI|nr:response regulator transcription factor [Arcticibacter pallidicorallinus]PRY49200.1 LuxR family two component transcriptional regulator [Arcticibacter pallidicorallinus]